MMPFHYILFIYYLLQAQNDYKVINMDQWMGFFRFCNEVASFSLLLLDCLYISYQEDGIFWLFFHSKVFSIVCSSQKNISVVTASNF